MTTTEIIAKALSDELISYFGNTTSNVYSFTDHADPRYSTILIYHNPTGNCLTLDIRNGNVYLYGRSDLMSDVDVDLTDPNSIDTMLKYITASLLTFKSAGVTNMQADQDRLIGPQTAQTK